jgi:uncharacterized protein (UPF0303 family)
MSLEDDLRVIAMQEQKLRFKGFDEEDAWNLGSRLRELAELRSYPLVIDIRRFGQPLFYCALAGSAPDNAEWARRKSNVVARFYRSSYGLGLELQQKNATLESKFGLTLADYAAHGGGFPLTVEEVGVIGSVTVSGLPQRVDHELVVEAIAEATGQLYSELRLGDER